MKALCATMEMAARTLWTLLAEEDPEKMQESLPETQSHAIVRSLPATAEHVSLQTRRLCAPLGKWRRLSAPRSTVFYYSARQGIYSVQIAACLVRS